MVFSKIPTAPCQINRTDTLRVKLRPNVFQYKGKHAEHAHVSYKNKQGRVCYESEHNKEEAKTPDDSKINQKKPRINLTCLYKH